jgi:DNA-binding MltR family transcriptional regulator
MPKETHDILKMMKTSVYPELNYEFIFKLSNESERGAVLIGTGKVEEYLEKLVLKILPINSKTYTSRLLKYPGAISSFSGKIELLFAFRIIDKRLYDSLNTLRKVRNEAAHSVDEFKLIDHEENQKKINDFQDDYVKLIEFLAKENLIKTKKSRFKKILDKENLSKTKYKSIWDETVENLEENPEIKEQVRVWILSYGLTFICLKIMAINEDLDIINIEGLTWIELMKRIILT